MSNSESLSAITSFANRLQQEIKKDKRGNFVFSPLGVTLCFGMAYLGAEGITKTEMATALGYPEDEESPFPADILRLLNNDNAVSPFTLLTAQKVYYEKGEEILPQYLESLKQLYAESGQFDTREPVRCANEINSWVRRSTNGEIQNIVSQDDLSDPNLRLILINTIYFHAKWATPFEQEDTEPEDFYLKDSNVVQVEMMNQHFGCQNSVEYVDSKKLQAEIVKLPYKGERFSLVVFIPKLKHGLSVVENGMLTTSVNEYLQELKTFKNELSQCILNVALPKFEIETSLEDLIKPLRQLGIEDAFDIYEADFSSISDDPTGLYISKVIQKAIIKVDETGTTAAAVTVCEANGGGGGGRRSKVKIINVVADRPFYFQLIEEKMEIVLFSGVVTDPRKKS